MVYRTIKWNVVNCGREAISLQSGRFPNVKKREEGADWIGTKSEPAILGWWVPDRIAKPV